MWIYTKNGFYSIVQDKDDPDFLIVRARIKGDLEALGLKSIAIKETPDNDYRYRIRAPKGIIAVIMSEEVTQIDYGNYKDSISDKRRSPYYGTAWAAMVDMQEELYFDTDKD